MNYRNISYSASGVRDAFSEGVRGARIRRERDKAATMARAYRWWAGAFETGAEKCVRFPRIASALREMAQDAQFRATLASIDEMGAGVRMAIHETFKVY